MSEHEYGVCFYEDGKETELGYLPDENVNGLIDILQNEMSGRRRWGRCLSGFLKNQGGLNNE